MKFWLLFIILPITRQSYMYSGRPLPKAEMLDEVLSRFMNDTDFTGSVFHFLGGEYDFGDPDNVDVTILDADNVFKIIGRVKKKYQGWFRRTKNEAVEKNPELVKKALDLMRQSIYSTRYRMKETERFRQKYTNNARYNIAIFYGALMQISVKMETLYSNMKKLPIQTHFVWFLIIYEKILAANVDIHMMVERIIDLHAKQKRIDSGYKVEIAPTISTKARTGKKSRVTGQALSTRSMQTIIATMDHQDHVDSNHYFSLTSTTTTPHWTTTTTPPAVTETDVETRGTPPDYDSESEIETKTTESSEEEEEEQEQTESRKIENTTPAKPYRKSKEVVDQSGTEQGT